MSKILTIFSINQKQLLIFLIIICILYIFINIFYERIRTLEYCIKQTNNIKYYKKLSLYIIFPFVCFISIIFLFFFHIKYKEIIQFILLFFTYPLINWILISLKILIKK